MYGNIRYVIKKRVLLNLLYGCITVALMLLSSCATGGSDENTVTEQSSPSPVTVTETPAPDPDATPRTVDLSEYPELTLPQLEPPADGEEIALLHTGFGIIKLRFFPEYAPQAVQNFKTHAKSGYYDGVTFHRVIQNSLIFSGDPEGTGLGGDSIWGRPFLPETHLSLHNIRGALAMNQVSQQYAQGSQFFIVANKELEDEVKAELMSYKDRQNEVAFELEDGTPVPWGLCFPESIIDKYLEDGGVPGLDLQYSVFGQVIDGLDVVDKIASVETSQEEETLDKPLVDIVIEKITFEAYIS